MGMFDLYRPAAGRRCPTCHRELREWQGKDGPNALLVWAEGTTAPVEQRVDEELAIAPEARERFMLPTRFVIYSYDCPDHGPVEADCAAPNGTWVEMVLRAVPKR